MGCLATLLLGLISRISILIWWLAYPQSHNLPFAGWTLPGNLVFPGWLWTIVGAIFLPWTTLVYLFVYPGGVNGLEWLYLAFALLIDLASHSGTYRNRSRFGFNR